MQRMVVLTASVVLLCAARPTYSAQPQDLSATSFKLPAGTKLELTVQAPVWARTAKSGDPLYLQTDFPVLAGGSVAIPAGTYVQGILQDLARPTRRLNRAELKILFTKIIFANGYAVVLPDSADRPSASSAPPSAAIVTIQVSAANDLLLDNGTQLEMTLAAPLALDAQQIAQAVARSRAVDPGRFKSATLCRPTPGDPGTPGSPDTVIPGSPGTSSTTIPGGPGMPDIVIPGTPATPDTVIPGSPGFAGTPGTVCPAPPFVITSEPLSLRATATGQIAASPKIKNP